jgi:hypothetical protein
MIDSFWSDVLAWQAANGWRWAWTDPDWAASLAGAVHMVGTSQGDAIFALGRMYDAWCAASARRQGR